MTARSHSRAHQAAKRRASQRKAILRARHERSSLRAGFDSAPIRGRADNDAVVTPITARDRRRGPGADLTRRVPGHSDSTMWDVLREDPALRAIDKSDASRDTTDDPERKSERKGGKGRGRRDG